MLTMPWRPLYTIERSDQPEVTVYGMIAVVSAGPAGTADLLACGDVNHAVWSRSCLKAFQLLSHFQTVKASYSDLKPEHLALMMSSHHSEKLHLDLLGEIMQIGDLSEDQLRCPARWPISTEMRVQLQAQGKQPKSLYHDCSGKHFSYLLSLKAKGLPLEHYLDVANPEHRLLEAVLSELLVRPADGFQTTTDGCQMVNYALTPRELAVLYRRLSAAKPEQSVTGSDSMISKVPKNGSAPKATTLGQLDQILDLFRRYPIIIGGSESFDTKLMQGKLPGIELPLIAKNGADGLLAIGVVPNSVYPDGLGILIKLSSGYEDRHMQAICGELFSQLGLYDENQSKAVAKPSTGPKVRTDHIKSHFHFQVDKKALAGVALR
jgi:L-asparaginase II